MKRHLLILILLVFLTSCHKDTTPAPRQLPAYTETGVNMMACKENGVVWVATGKPSFGFFTGGAGVYFTPFPSYLLLSGNNVTKSLVFQFNFKDSVGVYPLISQAPLYGVTFRDGDKTYFTDSVHGGTINVLHWDGSIISGKFSFDAVDSSGNVLHITDGEFDVKG